VHTAIAGFLRVAERQPNLSFTIVGAAIDQEYEASLKQLTSASPAGSRVHFAGKLAREEVARIYAEHDLLVFPSEWDEPFSIALIEAMASGLVIVGTQTGGTGEILIEGETGYAYKSGDAVDCAAAIDRARNDRTLSDQVRRQAATVVRQTLTMNAMIDQIENQLAGLVHEREVRP
jgi:glycogen synthase